MKKIVAVLIATLMLLTGVFALTACNDDKTATLRFVMPDGTPALAAASFLIDGTVKVAGYDVKSEIIAPTAVQIEIGSEKADIVIAPTNAGAALINNGADYCLAGVMVDGSLYVIGKPNTLTSPIDDAYGHASYLLANSLKGKRIASIGHNNTPDRVFKYIVDNTEGMTYDDVNDVINFEDGSICEIEWCADGPSAKVALMRDDNPCDFALVGEPAATAFGTPNGGGFSGRIDLQVLYAHVSGNQSFPQASLFVKKALYQNAEFMSALYQKLSESVAFAIENKADISSRLQAVGSTTTFPPIAISRCAITAKKADNDSEKQAIIDYLTLMLPNVNWQNANLF